ncbi:uncharacterized protein LOC111592126 isoform X2 [Drosophila hydei]|uniref:Uncharacterized protein LOC111592126 isoform X2 n=1 Tax=Drosophila hydei TaxID=7224 RepID=A0A6J1L743_DROHY|nr:uncharacterized protein LOC111592126 isoform X2 [Drosophila hydei]
MEDLQSQPYYYKLERRKFACITYTVTGCFLLFALIQWFMFHLLEDINTYFTRNYWLGIVFFIFSLLLIVVFIFFEDLRFSAPVNWIIAIIIYECIIVGVTSLIVRHYKYQLIMSFLIWTFVLLVFLVFGSFIPPL